MKFDFGEILSSAVRITWKHKIMWVFSALPALLSFLIFPVMFVPVFFMDESSYRTPFFIEEPAYIAVFIVFSIVITLLSYALYGISSSAVMFGVMRADSGTESFTFRELLDGSKPYWGRVLGVMLLIGLGIFVIFAAIFACFTLIGAVTMGLGFVCLQPLMLLMYPFMLIVYGIIEESQVAVVADKLGVTDAIRRGWELVRANFWRVVLISLIAYFGVTFLSSIVMFPLMSPFFLIPFFMDSGMTDFNPRTMMLFMGGFSLLFIPVMALVQGITLTFLKSTYTLVYLRLT
ncbi:MAG TPA: hypothetical protein VJ972_03070, partial [Anaerolineales bacterium]|nr:hypothetical protein [Anaerolineales bacterium]